MMDWAAGYVTEMNYTHGYFRELCPNLLRYALAQLGVAGPPPGKLRYLELGFGQGLSLAIHAAACPGTYWGTDFNPAHAAAARDVMAAAGVDSHIFDLSFAELAAANLPEFDVIALHGVWSWISDENRAIIVDLVRRKLAPGGILYVSYNCMTGTALSIPLRDLIKTHADVASGGEPMVQRIDRALAFAQGLADSGARYFRDHPSQTKLLASLREQDRAYLAHEYFNRDWQPAGFAEVADHFAAAKMDFAGPAHMLDMVESFQITPDQKTLLATVNNPVLRETARDCMINQDFRRDVFVKGRRGLSPAEQLSLLLDQAVVLQVPAEDVPASLPARQGTMGLQDAIYRPLLHLLADEGGGPKSIAALLAAPAWAGKPINMLLEALLILIGASYVTPAQSAEACATARPACAALNRHLRLMARQRGIASYLASPVTGGGVAVDRVGQMFLTAREAGKATPAGWAEDVWAALQAQQQRLIMDGKSLESAEANLQELTRRAEEFARKHIPVLEALGVA